MSKRPVPTELKKLRGTLQPCRTNHNEPKLTIEVPLAPDWMPDEVKQVFNDFALQFAATKVMTQNDAKALELLADAYHEYITARAFIYEHGSTYESETPTGKIVRAYPQVNIAADAFKRIRSMLIEFGATPAARTKVETVMPVEENPFKRMKREAEEREAIAFDEYMAKTEQRRP